MRDHDVPVVSALLRLACVLAGVLVVLALLAIMLVTRTLIALGR